jgi:hypothetical protein
MRGAIAACAAILLVGNAWADIPGPGPRPHPPQPAPKPEPQGTAVPLVVRNDPNARQSVLTIPKKLLPSDNAALDEPPATAPGAARSAIAAIALSCGIAGLFLIRRNRKTRTALVVLICVGCLATAGTLLADLAPPGGGGPHGRPPIRPQPAQTTGKVLIRLTDDGDAVTLILAGKATGGVRSEAPATGKLQSTPEPAGAQGPAAAPATQLPDAAKPSR